MNKYPKTPALPESASHRWIARKCKRKAINRLKVMFAVVAGSDLEDRDEMYLREADAFVPRYGHTIIFVAYPPGWKFRPKRDGRQPRVRR